MAEKTPAAKMEAAPKAKMATKSTGGSAYNADEAKIPAGRGQSGAVRFGKQKNDDDLKGKVAFTDD